MKKQIGRKQIKLLGQNIRIIRQARGISQEELANRSNVHPTYLSSVECGKRNPSLMIFLSIAYGLGVSPAALFQLDITEKFDLSNGSKARVRKKRN
jgi:transcriptional regulator with XRE-family HTH domain